MQTERRVAANPQTKPVDLGCESAENCILQQCYQRPLLETYLNLDIRRETAAARSVNSRSCIFTSALSAHRPSSEAEIRRNASAAEDPAGDRRERLFNHAAMPLLHQSTAIPPQTSSIVQMQRQTDRPTVVTAKDAGRRLMPPPLTRTRVINHCACTQDAVSRRAARARVIVSSLIRPPFHYTLPPSPPTFYNQTVYSHGPDWKLVV